MKSLSQSEYGELKSLYENVYSPKFESILDEFTDEEVDELTEEIIEEVVEEFFLECLEEGFDIESVEETLCESLDTSITNLNETYLMEMNPYAPAGSKESKAYNKATTASKRSADRAAKRKEVIGKVKKAVGKVGSALKAGAGKAAGAAKAGAKAAYKGANRAAGYAAGAAGRAASTAKSEFKKGYERGSKGSSSSSSDSGSSDIGSSSSSSDSGSSSGSSSSGSTRRAVGGAARKVGSLLKRGLKKAIGGAARAVEKGAGKVARRMGEELEATGLFSDKEIEAIMENIMKGPLLPGEGRPTYPTGKAPKPTGAKLPLAKKSGATTQMAGYEPEGEMVDEARRADKEGYARGTKENPERKDIPHGDPSQRTMLHSRLKRRADEMGRERRSSARNKAGGRTPVSKKEKAFLRAADRTASQVRNPNVPKTGEHKKQLNNSYDYILDYLMNEGFAKTEDSAKVIMSNMSEAWIKSILEQAPPPPFLPNANNSPKEQERKRREHDKKHSNYTGAGLGNRPVDGTGTGP